MTEKPVRDVKFGVWVTAECVCGVCPSCREALRALAYGTTEENR